MGNLSVFRYKKKKKKEKILPMKTYNRKSKKQIEVNQD